MCSLTQLEPPYLHPPLSLPASFMTAVLSATDALLTDRHLSADDNQFDYSSATTDWRAKYHEVVDMLAETRNELEDFQTASRDLEAEMEADLQRSEKQEQELRAKVAKADRERDEWKNKYMSLQTTHNTTTTSLQRELDRLRQDYQQIKVQLRDLEMGNDDLERNEREVSSSLADMEAKYAKALEEKILLEHELIEKASLEEELQRIKDELRDSQDEIAIMKEQISTASSAASSTATERPSTSRTSTLSQPIPRLSSEDDLLHSSLPKDLQLSDLSYPSVTDSKCSVNTTPKVNTVIKTAGQSALLQRAGFNPTKSTAMSPTGLSRSSTLPVLTSPRIPVSRTLVASTRHSSTNTTSAMTLTKNKGVQMVSEMRARVRVLEQKIHTRVPRLRMASSARPNTAVTPINALGSSSSSSSASLATTAKTSLDSIRRSVDSRRSNENETSKKDLGDTSGWVLIMEDSPSPQKTWEKERQQRDKRRLSSPSAPSAYRTGSPPSSGSSTSILSLNKSTLGQSTRNTGIPRPQSRMSGASLSTTTTGSSLPTPTSRPSTPTFLPLPTSSLYGNSSGIGLKRSTGPGGANPYSSQNYSNQKRTSLGTSTNLPPSDSYRERSTTLPPLPRPGSGTSSSHSYSRYDDLKSLPHLPGQSMSRRTRPPPPSSVLSKSRIGKPRKSGGSGNTSDLDVNDLLPRSSHGS